MTRTQKALRMKNSSSLLYQSGGRSRMAGVYIWAAGRRNAAGNVQAAVHAMLSAGNKKRPVSLSSK